MGGRAMHVQQEPNDQVRGELGNRIAAIGANSRAASAADLARDLDAVRRIAFAHGMLPAVTVAHALEAAVARGERGPLILGWLDILSDAIDCGRVDARTAETYAAACSVRFG